ncbi:MAG: putative Signal transducing adapter molecule 2 [Streblomastix strix]|uniref:Putative Signal transducing adapter molecule 2 n=1 Tax=Streblomastix strix TaxID=222440 RepID=A0A5J4VN40_9EUKA|nr:MAG: putative Signal transducing adapter molecule 2 [Streblomastix strix]
MKIQPTKEVLISKDIEEFGAQGQDGRLAESDHMIIADKDFTIFANKSDITKFLAIIGQPISSISAPSTSLFTSLQTQPSQSYSSSSFYFHTVFDAPIPLCQFNFCKDAIDMIEQENAGGNSENSEQLSFEIFHRMFGAKLLKTEMQIKYDTDSWKKTDYLCEIQGHKIGVSVTRTVDRAPPNDFTEEKATVLLGKKLFGVCVSNIGVREEDKWERQILHCWSQTPAQAQMMQNAFESFHPRLREKTIIIFTIAGNHKWIFRQQRRTDP